MPPLLGFFSNDHGSPFFFARAAASTTAMYLNHLSPPSSALAAAAAGRRADVFDCKHGLVLLGITTGGSSGVLKDLVLWDPLTDHEDLIPAPDEAHNYGAPALVCAPRGRLIGVALAYSDMPRHSSAKHGYFTMASLFRPETRKWGGLAIMPRGCSFDVKPSTAVRDAAVFWITEGSSAMLEYKVETPALQWIWAPVPVGLENRLEFAVVPPAKGSADARLGLVFVLGASIVMLCFREDEEGGNYEPLRRETYTVVDDDEGVQDNPEMMPARAVIGFAEEANAIFVQTGRGVFMLDLDTKQHRRVFGTACFSHIYPFYASAGKAVLYDAQQDQGKTQSGGVTISVDGTSENQTTMVESNFHPYI